MEHFYITVKSNRAREASDSDAFVMQLWTKHKLSNTTHANKSGFSDAAFVPVPATINLMILPCNCVFTCLAAFVQGEKGKMKRILEFNKPENQPYMRLPWLLF